MATSSGIDEVLSVANTPGLTESGGGHGSKGVDFQRWWAVLRMLELEHASASDFLLLFESVQDVTELDSATHPTIARIYQVKKKDRGEWSWAVLTGTAAPKPPPKKPPKTPRKNVSAVDSKKVADSPLGKIHQSLDAFPSLPVEGHFVSNAGCDVPLASGGNAATSMPCSLSDLAPEHVTLLSAALQSLCPPGSASIDLQRLRLKKVALHPDSPAGNVVHVALDFLTRRSPRHAGQASSFVESLVTQVSPLGRHTDVCATFDQLVKERGFTRKDFLAALGALEETPDYLEHLEGWLTQLQHEGMGFMTITNIRAQAARVFREQLLASAPPTSQKISDFCDAWIAINPSTPMLTPYFDDALVNLKIEFPGFRDEELLARFALRAIKSCVDLT